MARNISFTLKFWRQNGPKAEGHFDTREMKDIPDDTSFLEMLDILNEELIEEGRSLSSSTTIAARVSAVCAHSISTDIPTAPLLVPQPASSTCVASTMAM